MKTLGSEDLAELNRELAALVERRLPLPPALRDLAGEARGGRLAAALEKVRAEVEGGAALSTALQRAGAPPTYVALVVAGEVSGDVGAALELLADQAEADASRARRLEVALAYPASLTCAALVLVGLLFAVPLPMFRTMFDQLGLELPWLTEVYLRISDLVFAHLVPGTVAILGMGALIVLFGPRLAGRLFAWQTPVARLGQLAGTLASFLERGAPAAAALRALGPCERGLLPGTLERAACRLEGGARLADALELEHVFPHEVVWTLGAAEARGTLPAALRELGARQARRFEGWYALVVEVFAPLLLLPIAGLVVTTLFAVFLPIFKLSRML